MPLTGSWWYPSPPCRAGVARRCQLDLATPMRAKHAVVTKMAGEAMTTAPQAFDPRARWCWALPLRLGVCFVLSTVAQHSPSSTSPMLRLPFAAPVDLGVAYLDGASWNFLPLKYATLQCSFPAKGSADDFTRSRGHRDAADGSSGLRGASTDLPVSLSATIDSTASGTGSYLHR